MSWSLQISNGDFLADGAHLSTVVRQQKLVQDITCAIVEHMGTDNLHPEFGSIIDGGVTPDGVVHPGVIGETDIDLAVLEVESEITRIGRYVQQTQLARAKRDKQVYGRATLEPEEVLIEIDNIEYTQTYDSLSVLVHLTSATGDTFDLTLNVPTD